MLSLKSGTYGMVMGLLRVPRYGVRIFNRMVSFILTRNALHHLSAQNIILSEIDNKWSI
jgi:hypothetical protein